MSANKSSLYLNYNAGTLLSHFTASVLYNGLMYWTIHCHLLPISITRN